MSSQLGISERCQIFSGGMELVPNSFLPEFNQVPARKHNRRKHKNSAYHKRIQKKWIKRFGYEQERSYFLAGGTVFAHPNTIAMIVDACV